MSAEHELVERLGAAMRAEVERLEPRRETLERVLARRPVARRGAFGLADSVSVRERRRPRIAGLVPVLAAVLALAVAAIAVTDLGHRHTAGSSPRSVPPAARDLVARLAVLRRPQTEDDRLPAGIAARALDFAGHGRLVAGLSRLVVSPPVAARVYLIVETPTVAQRRLGVRAGPLLAPSLGDQASVVIVSGHRVSVASMGEPATLLDHPGMELLDQGFAQGGPGDVRRLEGIAAGIVPDGVSEVVWHFSNGAVIHPSIADNVAFADVSAAAGILALATWYGGRRDRVLIASFADPLVRPAAGAIARSDREPVAVALIRHFAVLRSRADLAAALAGASLSSAAYLPLLRGGDPGGLNVGQARFVPDPAAPTAGNGPQGLWVVPGARAIALLADSQLLSATAALTGPGSALQGRLHYSTAYGDGAQTIVGLVPDGNRSVTVLLRGGRRLTAPVIDNVYSVYVPPSPVALLVYDAAGRLVRIPLRSGS